MTASIDLEYPFTGPWLVQNSPANRVPSHGTSRFATSFSIDFIPVDEGGRTAPLRLMSLLRSERVEAFPGFGRPVLAPVEGLVVGVHDEESDHVAHRGLPSIGYALSQRRRVGAGWRALAGNHVFIQSQGVVVTLCHLQQGSASVEPGQWVEVGDMLARCGNSGNSTEPHLHLQAIDRAGVEHARAVRITFRGDLPRNGEIVGTGTGTGTGTGEGPIADFDAGSDA